MWNKHSERVYTLLTVIIEKGKLSNSMTSVNSFLARRFARIQGIFQQRMEISHSHLNGLFDPQEMSWSYNERDDGVTRPAVPTGGEYIVFML